MPRKGDNISRTATGRWTARAKTKRVIQTPEGPVTRWKGVERTFDTHEAARQWRRLVLSAEKSGEGWTDARSRPVTALRDLGMGAGTAFYRWRKRYGGVYKPASRRPRTPPATLVTPTTCPEAPCAPKARRYARGRPDPSSLEMLHSDLRRLLPSPQCPAFAPP